MGPRAQVVLSQEGDHVRTLARATGRWSTLALTLGLVAGGLGIIGVALGTTSFDASRAVALRSVLSLLTLVCVMAYAGRRWSEQSLAFFLSAATVGYLLMPLSWSGAALFGQWMTGGHLGPFAIDLVVWLLLSWLLVSLEGRRSRPVEEPSADVQALLR